MFIGHFAVGFAAKKVAPSASLATLVASALFLDMLWPVFLALGIESVRIDPGNTAFTPLDLHDYPYSHSLAGALVWSALFAGTHFSIKRDAKVAAILAGGVFSHFILDWITHRPDMPLWPGSTTVIGLGLWNSVPGTIAVEVTMFCGGLFIYLRSTQPTGRKMGTVGLWTFVAFLLAAYFGNAFGPPPPNVTAIIAATIAAWALLFWLRAIDRARTPR